MIITLAKKNITNFEYRMKGEILEAQATMYLGITVSSDLTWNRHINTMTAKAYRVLNFLKRNLKKYPKSVKEKAYTTYVWPITEYASTVWDPHTKENTEKIEKVQRRATRFTTGSYDGTVLVTTMVQILGWPTLQQRRSYTNLVMFYKIAHHLVAIHPTISDK